MRMSEAKPKISSVAEYEQTIPAHVHSAWRELRKAVVDAAPDAEEVISYQMPALKQNGMVIYYSATPKHLALSFPSPKIFQDMKEELAPFEVGKTSIKFPLDEPVPVSLIRRIVVYRVEEEQKRANSKAGQAR